MPVRTFTTAGVDNLWSNAANWDTGVPLNTDTAIIPVGQTCDFDVDQSAFAAGVTFTINGTLQCLDAAGTYYAKQQAATTGTGTLKAGTAVTPLATDRRFTWDLNGFNFGAAGGGPTVLVYCTNPTNRYISLSGAEAAGQTELSVDTDVTGDIWAVGDTVVIVDKTAARDVETKVIAAGGIAVDHIDVTVGLAAAKVQGARLFLLTRNVRFINGPATTGTFYNIGSGSYVRAEVSTGTTANVFRACTNCTFDGIAYIAATTTSPAHAFSGCTNGVLSGIAVSSSATSYLIDGISTGLTVTSTGILAGAYSPIQGTLTSLFRNTIFNGEVFVATTACISNINGLTMVDAKFELSPYGLFDANGCYVDGVTFTTCTTAMCSCARCVGVDLVTIGGTTDLDTVAGEFYNCTFASATEYANYNLLEAWMYTCSEKHDTVAGAYAGWSKGGVCVSNVVTVPPGFARSYQHIYESATLWNLRQFHVVVPPGVKLTAKAWLRKDLLIATAANRPTLALVNPVNDPLANSAYANLASATMTNSIDTWEQVTASWTNTDTVPANVLVRILSRDVGGGPNYFYEQTQFSFTGDAMGGGMFLYVAPGSA